LIAIGGAGPEVRLHDSKEAKRVATLKGHDGAVFALAFHPTDKEIAVGGFDGTIRVYDTAKGELLRSFIPVPLSKEPLQRASK
jgi:WD40 repeat protein